MRSKGYSSHSVYKLESNLVRKREEIEGERRKRGRGDDRGQSVDYSGKIKHHISEVDIDYCVKRIT